jgi:arsenate reductase
MAAALLNKICGEFFEAHSAGLEPGVLNPLAVDALREIEIDISKNKTQAVFDVFKSGQLFPYVITGVTTRLHWPFDDPSKLRGTHEEKLASTRRILKKIEQKVREFCDQHCAVEMRS